MPLSSPDSDARTSAVSDASSAKSGLPLENPLLPCLLMFAWIVLGAWIRPLGMPDEGRYTGVAWEMVRSGQWLTPTLDGLPYFHKPPMFYWLTAISIKLFGTAELALRLASILGATLISYAGFRLLKQWISQTAAVWYLLVLSTLPYFYAGAQFANHDMLVASFIGAAIVFAADALLSADHGRAWKGSMLAAWACIALGLLSKGLIGIVLPGSVIFAWLLLQRRWHWLGKLFWWPGPVLFALIAAPWFVLMQQKFPAFFHYFFIHQHFERFVDQTNFDNFQPWWYYAAALTLLGLPWSLLLLAQLRVAATDAVHSALRQLLWLWIVLIVVFFSISASKLIGYALPAVPPVAMLAAGVISRQTSRRAPQLAAAVVVLSGLLLVGAVWVLGHESPYSSKPLGQAYRARAAAGEPLISLNVYRFDLPVYAQLQEPIPVLLDWSAPSVRTNDSWPRELADAARFDPAAGERVLIDRTRLREVLCAHTITWVVTQVREKNPLLSTAENVAANPFYQLLRFDLSRSGLSCDPAADEQARTREPGKGR
jgi:4-amino-4-deoxy-L-arabinose transferase-like glycosyltransferase